MIDPKVNNRNYWIIIVKIITLILIVNKINFYLFYIKGLKSKSKLLIVLINLQLHNNNYSITEILKVKIIAKLMAMIVAT